MAKSLRVSLIFMILFVLVNFISLRKHIGSYVKVLKLIMSRIIVLGQYHFQSIYIETDTSVVQICHLDIMCIVQHICTMNYYFKCYPPKSSK